MNRLLRVICGLLLAGVVSLQAPVYAEEGEFQEIIAEAVYPIGPSDTLAKAETQALLLAEQNALAQAGIANLTTEDIHNLPETVFSVTILDKKKTVSDNRLAYWMQIKALIKPDQIETALKSINPIWGGPAEYYDEGISYTNGKESSRMKSWTKNGWCRTDCLSGISQGITTLCKYEKNNGVITARTWILKNNKYYEDTPQKFTEKDELIGMDQLNGVSVEKMRTTSVYPDSNYTGVSTKWVDPVTKCTLKYQFDAQGFSMVTIYQNQQIGPQEDSLFAIPAGYTKCASFEELDKDANKDTSNNQVDPLQKASDAALEATAQKVLDNAIGGLFKF